MESFFVRFRNALVLIAILLAQTILLAVQVREPAGPGQPDGTKILLLRRWAAAAVTPFERVTTYAGKGVRNGWSDYVNLRNTRQQNEDLQKEIARLRLEQAEFAEDAIQGHRLQALLAFRQQYVANTIAAQVIGTSGVEQSRMLLIDKGADFGLKPDMAVITPDGVVGKLRDVFPHTSQVLEIDDPSSGAGVILANTRIRAIVRGGPGGTVQIGNLSADSRIKPGELVITSGGDQVFPRGLKVGTIESVAPDKDRQLYTLIKLHPAANLSQLEEVLVITGTQAELPAMAQQDLDAGKVTGDAIAATEAKRAADLAAERLPSITATPSAEGDSATNPDATGTAAADSKNPKIPGSAVPKPLPVLHPDRYTPGTTPPADELTPGGANSNGSPATDDPAALANPGDAAGTNDPKPVRRPPPKPAPANPPHTGAKEPQR